MWPFIVGVYSGIAKIGVILLQLSVNSNNIVVTGGDEAFIWVQTNIPSSIGLQTELGVELGTFHNTTAVGYILQTIPVKEMKQETYMAWAVNGNQTDIEFVTLTILP